MVRLEVSEGGNKSDNNNDEGDTQISSFFTHKLKREKPHSNTLYINNTYTHKGKQ